MRRPITTGSISQPPFPLLSSPNQKGGSVAEAEQTSQGSYLFLVGVHGGFKQWEFSWMIASRDMHSSYNEKPCICRGDWKIPSTQASTFTRPISVPGLVYPDSLRTSCISSDNENTHFSQGGACELRWMCTVHANPADHEKGGCLPGQLGPSLT
jgi:hypothetical protein